MRPVRDEYDGDKPWYILVVGWHGSVDWKLPTFDSEKEAEEFSRSMPLGNGVVFICHRLGAP